MSFDKRTPHGNICKGVDDDVVMAKGCYCLFESGKLLPFPTGEVDQHEEEVPIRTWTFQEIAPSPETYTKFLAEAWKLGAYHERIIQLAKYNHLYRYNPTWEEDVFGMPEQKLGPRQEAWLKALESGEYQQGRWTLTNADGAFCCLGVACEVAAKLGLPLRLEQADSNHGVSFVYVDAAGGYATNALTANVRDFFGFYSVMGASESKGLKNLAFLNDKTGLTFKQIAEIVRGSPSSYFKSPM